MDNIKETVWELKSKEIIEEMLRLKEEYYLKDFKAIELYGGDGHTLSNKMSEQCISFIGYDINPEKEEGFRRNVTNGEFRCGDSVKMMKTMMDGEIGFFNLISADSPICIYGENYCEHFGILECVYKLLQQGEKALCVFPVVTKPYDTEKEENSVWISQRKKFYKTEDINLDLERVYAVYDEIFNKQGLQILDRSYTCREYRNGIDWMYEFMYVLEK